MPALPPVTIAYFPSSMSLLQGNGGSAGAGFPGMVIENVVDKAAEEVDGECARICL